MISNRNYGRYPARRSTTPVARHPSPPWITPSFWKILTFDLFCKIFFIFLHSSGFLFTINSEYFFNSWCSILDYFILNCKPWDKFLNSMIIFILIISCILMFYRNFELIFEFMALKRAPICGRNVCLAFFEYFYI